MADPLSELRDCILNNKDIREEEDNVYLGENSWPKSTATSFKSSPKGPNPEELYTLDALLFFLKNSSLPHVVYYNKAQSLGIQHVKRYDRKSLLKFLTGSSENKTEVTPVYDSKRKSSDEDQARPSKKPRVEKVQKKRKPPDNTVSAKKVQKKGKSSESLVSAERVLKKGKSLDSSVSAEKVQKKGKSQESSVSAEKVQRKSKSPDRSVSSEEVQEKNTSPDRGSIEGSSIDEPSHLDTSLGNDDTTTTTGTQTDPDNQSATIQAYQAIISRLIKFLQDDLGLSREEQESVLEGKKISLRRVQQRYKIQTCFVAVPHPVYEWDTVKEDGAHVVSGQRINQKADDIERRYQCVLDNCLKRGEADLKESLSLLISHMRDLNKSNLSETEVDVSSKRTLEYCLTSAQEDFREMFESLLSVVDDNSQDTELQRWISESEVELRKLLNSLMLSLQTLRDVSACSRTLFHFPEPIVSIALNPTKVTHSVVLEIYVRLGLAELRRILVNIISSIEKARTSVQQSQGEQVEVDDPDPMEIPHGERPTSAASSSDQGQSTDSPSNTLVESIKNDWSVDEPEGSGTHKKKPTRRRSVGQQSRTGTSTTNSKESSSDSTPTDAFWKSTNVYSSFKTTIGNTLVTSFKKRIQEKIEASATTEECISWLRTKKGLV